MKKQTIVIISALLVLVNIGLFITIYNMLNPEKKLLVNQLDVKQELVTLQEKVLRLETDVNEKIASAKEEVNEVTARTTEADESALAQNSEAVKSQTEQAEKLMENVYSIEEWHLSFELPEDPSKYSITVSKDLVTIEKHLEVMAYILRYDEGVEPSIEGTWDALGIYEGKSYYLRHGTSIVAPTEEVDEERQTLYRKILQSYFFEMEEQEE